MPECSLLKSANDGDALIGVRWAEEVTMICARSIIALSCAVAAVAAHATYHTLEVEEVYSNADGTVQYVVLHESAGMDGQNQLTGKTLTATHNGVTKTFTFTKNLPGGSCDYYMCTPSPTAGKRVLVASQGFAALGLVTPDYTLPNQFLPTDGATIVYAGVDQMTYPLLPTDGVNAARRDGTTSPNLATTFNGGTASAPASVVDVVEYYNAGLDHYFISALEPDIDALDSGRIGGWARTTQTFHVYPSQASGGAGVNPVCRFYIPVEHGNSHFFSASPAECASILQKTTSDPNYSGYEYESPNVFYVALPDITTGDCPANTVPVYRLWNQRADSNHRYTTDPAIKAQMLAKGYVAEGYGPNAVIMCAPA